METRAEKLLTTLKYIQVVCEKNMTSDLLRAYQFALQEFPTNQRIASYYTFILGQLRTLQNYPKLTWQVSTRCYDSEA